MSESSPARRRRSDAERSRAAILDAAAQVLGERPEASIEEIAEAAGVTRQTVYAHYVSREALLRAVVDRATDEVVAAMDAAEPDTGPAPAALGRLLDASWQAVARYPALFRATPLSQQESDELHVPIVERFERVIRRGRRRGEFDRELPADWLLAATIGLAHAAGEQVGAGRMKPDKAADALRRTIARVYGLPALDD